MTGQKIRNRSKRTLAAGILLLFLVNTISPVSIARAQSVGVAPAFCSLTPSFQPALLKGLRSFSDKPFHFDFIVEDGAADPSGDSFSLEADKLIKYFLVALALPEKDLWVNLSPYERERIMPDNFSRTEMGRILLEQDGVLKRLASSLTHPDQALGKEFWRRVYALARTKYGTADVPVDALTKVWVMPDKAVVYEKPRPGTQAVVFVTESHLKVMLEKDYFALSREKEGSVAGGLAASPASPGKAADDISEQVAREILVPEIEKEVNAGRTFSELRQAYNAVILAAWYKSRLKDSVLGKGFADQGQIAGAEAADPAAKEKIYEDYLAVFRQGVYNLIREEPDPQTGEAIPRKYFSGGMDLGVAPVVTGAPPAPDKMNGPFSVVSGFMKEPSPVKGGEEGEVPLKWLHPRFERLARLAVEAGVKKSDIGGSKYIEVFDRQEDVLGSAPSYFFYSTVQEGYIIVINGFLKMPQAVVDDVLNHELCEIRAREMGFNRREAHIIAAFVQRLKSDRLSPYDMWWFEHLKIVDMFNLRALADEKDRRFQHDILTSANALQFYRNYFSNGDKLSTEAVVKRVQTYEDVFYERVIARLGELGRENDVSAPNNGHDPSVLLEVKEFHKAIERLRETAKAGAAQVFVAAVEITVRWAELERSFKNASEGDEIDVLWQEADQARRSFLQALKGQLARHKKKLREDVMIAAKIPNKELTPYFLKRLKRRAEIMGKSFGDISPVLAKKLNLLEKRLNHMVSQSGLRGIIWKNFIDEHDWPNVGRESANAGEIRRALELLKKLEQLPKGWDIRVPEGFAIQRTEYDLWVKAGRLNKLNEGLKQALAIGYRDLVSLQGLAVVDFMHRDKNTAKMSKDVMMEMVFKNDQEFRNIEDSKGIQLYITQKRADIRSYLKVLADAESPVSESLRRRLEVFGSVVVQSSDSRQENEANEWVGERVVVTGLDEFYRAVVGVWGSGAKAVLVEEIINDSDAFIHNQGGMYEEAHALRMEDKIEEVDRKGNVSVDATNNAVAVRVPVFNELQRETVERVANALSQLMGFPVDHIEVSISDNRLVIFNIGAMKGLREAVERGRQLLQGKDFSQTAPGDSVRNDPLGGISMDARPLKLSAEGEPIPRIRGESLPLNIVFKDGLVPQITGIRHISGQELSLMLTGG